MRAVGRVLRRWLDRLYALRGVLRRWLDRLYTLGGVLGALCLIAILTLVTLQMLARWTGEVFPGAPDYAGYFMAAASFLAFAVRFSPEAESEARDATERAIAERHRAAELAGAGA